MAPAFMHEVFHGDVRAMQVSSKRKSALFIARIAFLATGVGLLVALLNYVCRPLPDNLETHVKFLIYGLIFITNCDHMRQHDPFMRAFGFSLTHKQSGILLVCFTSMRLAEELFVMWTAHR